MRIIHTCLRYPPATGGVERYVQEIVERTLNSNAGHDVRVLSSTMRTHGPITELDPNLLLDDPPYLQRLHHASTPLLSYPRLQALPYYLGHHAPDLIHGYSFWYQPADVAARYAAKHNLPFIFHPMYYHNATRQKPHWQLYQKTYGRTTFALADVVVVISPQEQALIESAGLPVKRFALIPPGVDSQKYQAPRPNPFEPRGLSQEVILSVSRLATGKGLADVITALPIVLQQRPATNLAIVGEDFGAKQQLEKLVKKHGLTKQVHFLGRLSDEELIAAYQHAKLLVHPSHYEAFGLVLAEAMAAGTPVVARNIAAVPFVAPHNLGGLLFSTHSELSQHLITVLKKDKLRQTLGQQGQKHVRNNFEWQQQIKKITELYRQLGST